MVLGTNHGRDEGQHGVKDTVISSFWIEIADPFAQQQLSAVERRRKRPRLIGKMSDAAGPVIQQILQHESWIGERAICRSQSEVEQGDQFKQCPGIACQSACLEALQ